MKKIIRYLVIGFLLLIIIVLSTTLIMTRKKIIYQENGIDEIYQLWKLQVDSIENLNIQIDSLQNELIIRGQD